MPERWRTTFIADTHAGSDMGLYVGDPVHTSNGQPVPPTPASKWLASMFDQHLEAERHAARDHDRRVLCFVGDVTDGGYHHRNLNHYHLDPGVEKAIARGIVQTAVEALEPDLIFVVLGSAAHVGQAGEREESIGAWLLDRYGERLQRPDDHRYGWHRINAEWGGLRFDVKHEGRMGRLEVTRESYFIRAVEEIWLSYTKYRDAEWVPDVAVRAHNHKFVDTGPVAPHRRGIRGFALPCYQLGTYWARQKFETSPDIGMLGLTVQGGLVRDVFPQIVTPRRRQPLWTP